MAIIIHDFEVTVEPKEKQDSQTSAGTEHAGATPDLRPEDIARIERHYSERRRRLRAN